MNANETWWQNGDNDDNVDDVDDKEEEHDGDDDDAEFDGGVDASCDDDGRMMRRIMTMIVMIAVMLI